MFGRQKDASLDSLTALVRERKIYLAASSLQDTAELRRERKRIARRAGRAARAQVSELMGRGVPLDSIRKAVERGVAHEYNA